MNSSSWIDVPADSFLPDLFFFFVFLSSVISEGIDRCSINRSDAEREAHALASHRMPLLQQREEAQLSSSIYLSPANCLHSCWFVTTPSLSTCIYCNSSLSLSLSPADMITMVYLIDFEKSSYLLYYIWSTACVYLFFLISLINYGLWWNAATFSAVCLLFIVFFLKKRCVFLTIWECCNDIF